MKRICKWVYVYICARYVCIEIIIVIFIFITAWDKQKSTDIIVVVIIRDFRMKCNLYSCVQDQKKRERNNEKPWVVSRRTCRGVQKKTNPSFWLSFKRVSTLKYIFLCRLIWLPIAFALSVQFSIGSRGSSTFITRVHDTLDVHPGTFHSAPPFVAQYTRESAYFI